MGVARDYPIGLIIFTSLGGLFLLALGIRKRLSGSDSIPENAEPTAYGRVAVILAASVAYAFLIYLVGFYLASAAFLFGSAMALSDVDAAGGRKKLVIASCIFTAVMCISVWLVFSKLLYVPTPEGLLF